MPEPLPDYRDRTRLRLREIVEDAAGQPPLFTPLEIREVGPNAVADLRVRWRGIPGLPEPDECELSILHLLYSRGRTRERDIIVMLEEYYSETTIKKRLRKLRRIPVIRSSKVTPRGYDLAPNVRFIADCA